MPAPYSEDLRQKAIEAVSRGERKIEVSRMLKISRNTLDLWLVRQAETGSCQVKVTTRKPNSKIKDHERLREFVKLHGEKTQIQMAKLWGEGVTQQNISDAMKKIGISRKKRVTGIESEMKQNGKSLKNG